MKKTILKINEKNLNNRIYTEESVKNILQNTSNNSIFIYESFTHFSSPNISKAVGIVESFERDNDYIIANIRIFVHHKDTWGVLSETMPLRPAGKGKIGENHDVIDYHISYLCSS